MCCAAADELVVAVPASANCCRVVGSSSQSVAVTPSGASAANTERPVSPPPATSTGVPGFSSDGKPRPVSRLIGATPQHRFVPLAAARLGVPPLHRRRRGHSAILTPKTVTGQSCAAPTRTYDHRHQQLRRPAGAGGG